MENLNEITEEQKIDIINIEFLAERQTLGFEKIEEELPTIELDEYFEVPPIIIDNRHLAKIFAFSLSDDYGKWLRLMLRIYLEGGRVLYKKKDNITFVVAIKFK